MVGTLLSVLHITPGEVVVQHRQERLRRAFCRPRFFFRRGAGST